MKRGYAGDIVPLLPAMLGGVAMDQGEGLAQPTEPHPTPVDPLPSTSQPPILSPPHPSPPHQSPPRSLHQSPHQSPPLSPFQSSPYSLPHSSPPRSYEAHLPKGNTSGSAEASMQLKDLMVKSLEKVLKRKSKKVIVSASEGEEPEDQGRIIQDINDDPLVSLVRESMKEKSTDFVTPTKASGEAQEEDISPTILEVAKTLSKVASQGVSKVKSTDKGKRYRRRARLVAKNINTRLDVEEEINTGIEEVSTGSAKVNSGTASKRGQREGKAPMVEEDIQGTHKTKEQIRQEAARLEEAIRLQAQMDEEAEVQKAAQFYTEEDWDTIRAKLEANTESIESFVPMETEARVKRHGLQLEQEQETSKKQKIDIKDASFTKGKDEVIKEEETEVLVKKTGMRRKQKARKGINIDKTAQDEFNKEREAYVKDKVKDASSKSEIGVDAIPTSTKPPTIIN
ncbi:hypothetical protein Tco_0462356 [Tanacetum coccineum]